MVGFDYRLSVVNVPELCRVRAAGLNTDQILAIREICRVLTSAYLVDCARE